MNPFLIDSEKAFLENKDSCSHFIIADERPKSVAENDDDLDYLTAD